MLALIGCFHAPSRLRTMLRVKEVCCEDTRPQAVSHSTSRLLHHSVRSISRQTRFPLESPEGRRKTSSSKYSICRLEPKLLDKSNEHILDLVV